MDNQNVYKIFWVDKKTGKTGQSTEPMNHKIATSWVNTLNLKYQHIQHFILNFN
jgi:hypothetical protein